ncbi:hypothetical protein [Spirosoma sp.]|uniref:hypothetical protein n=1 Tax=Spirosoma sp. TaxID=1899569 RepID=UPI003B3B7DBB
MENLTDYNIDNCVYIQDASDSDIRVRVLASDVQTVEDRHSKKFSLVHKSLSGEKKFPFFSETIKGIPLSDKLLCKLGFNWIEPAYHASMLTKNPGFVIWHNSKGEYFVNKYLPVSERETDYVSVEFLHHLQNYCSVIGEPGLLDDQVKQFIGMSYVDFQREYLETE